jgi:hypothetical protein
MSRVLLADINLTSPDKNIMGEQENSLTFQHCGNQHAQYVQMPQTRTTKMVQWYRPGARLVPSWILVRGDIGMKSKITLVTSH